MAGRLEQLVSPDLRRRVQRVADSTAAHFGPEVFTQPLPSWSTKPPSDQAMAHALQFGRVTDPAVGVELDRLLREDPRRLLDIEALMNREIEQGRHYRLQRQCEKRQFAAARRRLSRRKWAFITRGSARTHVGVAASGRGREHGCGPRRTVARRSSPRSTRAGPGGEPPPQGDDEGPSSCRAVLS